MSTRFLQRLILFSLFLPLTANAISIVYSIDRIVGPGSVTGTITTDGTLGRIGHANITAFDLALNDGTDTFAMSSAVPGTRVDGFGAAPLFATLSELTFDFDEVSDTFIAFFSNDPDGAWAMQARLTGIGFEEMIHTKEGVEHRIELNTVTGLQTIATATTVLPEPGTLSLLMIGLVGIAWVRRRKIA